MAKGAKGGGAGGGVVIEKEKTVRVRPARAATPTTRQRVGRIARTAANVARIAARRITG